MLESTVEYGGQIQIPKQIRDSLRLQPGDQVQFLIEENGQVVLQLSLRRQVEESRTKRETPQPQKSWKARTFGTTGYLLED
jgi:AbrB family looped-hinge helix DNA binding protein